MKKKFTLSILLLLGLLYSNVYAKDYIVEVIFFENLGSTTESTRVSTKQYYPDTSRAINIEQQDSARRYSLVQPESFRLTESAQKLQKSKRYRILKHISWRQPGEPKEHAKPILIAAGHDYSKEYPERTYSQVLLSDENAPVKRGLAVNALNGTVTIVLGRYLHLYTDLVYRKPVRAIDAQGNSPVGKSVVLTDFPIKTRRKMRSSELHYIDHPALGILVEIYPAE